MRWGSSIARWSPNTCRDGHRPRLPRRAALQRASRSDGRRDPSIALSAFTRVFNALWHIAPSADRRNTLRYSALPTSPALRQRLAHLGDVGPGIARQKVHALAQIVDAEVVGADALRKLVPGERSRD